jgi:hypothetical protein
MLRLVGLFLRVRIPTPLHALVVEQNLQFVVNGLVLLLFLEEEQLDHAMFPVVHRVDVLVDGMQQLVTLVLAVLTTFMWVLLGILM